MESLYTQDRQLSKLREILISADSISDVLPASLEKSLQHDGQIQSTLQPLIEKVIAKSIEQDRGKMIAILSPIIGSTIKRSVTETIRSWSQSVENVIQRSLTVEGLKWRIEAKRTGIPVSQIAMRHSLLFRVEHIFLIHKDSNKILCDCHKIDGIDTDSTLFAGMVDVINSFVKDVFIDHQRPQLESMQFDQYTILFTEVDSLLLATIIWGIPSLELKTQLLDVLNQIVFKKADSLELSNSDEKKFLDCEPMLEALLIERKKEHEPQNKSVQIILSVTAGLALLTVGLFVFRYMQHQYSSARFDKLIEQIRSSDDIYLVDYHKDDRLFLSILSSPSINIRDTLFNMAEKLKLNPANLDIHIVDIARLSTEMKLQQSNLLDEYLKSISGKVLTTGFKNDTLRIQELLLNVKKPYFLSREINQAFHIVLEYPNAEQKDRVDSLAGYMRFHLEHEGIYDYHFIRTQQNTSVKEITVTVFQEKPNNLSKKSL